MPTVEETVFILDHLLTAGFRVQTSKPSSLKFRVSLSNLRLCFHIKSKTRLWMYLSAGTQDQHVQGPSFNHLSRKNTSVGSGSLRIPNPQGLLVFFSVCICLHACTGQEGRHSLGVELQTAVGCPVCAEAPDLVSGTSAGVSASLSPLGLWCCSLWKSRKARTGLSVLPLYSCRTQLVRPAWQQITPPTKPSLAVYTKAYTFHSTYENT